jgi:mRNA interferase YafQ
MLRQTQSSRFKKDIRKINDKNIILRVQDAVRILANGGELPQQYKRHSLIGKYSGFDECHITPDLLLLFSIDAGELYLYRIASHSELFKK